MQEHVGLKSNNKTSRLNIIPSEGLKVPCYSSSNRRVLAATGIFFKQVNFLE